ncbi:MAG: hypothetical protein FWD47_11835 [Treponema sp.]|nr:hypothetical protein [Treponema sp.]
MNKLLHILTVLIILLALITSGLGLFYTTDGQPYNFINQYGDNIKIYGNGIYKNDTLFMAPIFRGTDCTIFFLAIPLTIISLVLDIKKNTIKTKLFLTSLIALFVYYSASISLGIVYNVLHLIYIALFGSSFYALITGFTLLKNYKIKKDIKMQTNGLKIFLVFCGLSLFIAWLPDIITSIINKKSLELIEVYTTQITYVLDMGIISPLIFICMYNLLKKNDIGYILLGIILTILIIIGIMLPIQSIFQISAGVSIPIEALITKVGIFVLLAIVALYYEVKLFKSI